MLDNAITVIHQIALNLIFYNIEDQTTWEYKKTLFTLRCWDQSITSKRIEEIATQWRNLITKISNYARFDTGGYKFTSFPLENDDRSLTINTIESLFRFDINDLGFSTFKWNASFHQLMENEKLMDFEVTYHETEQKMVMLPIL